MIKKEHLSGKEHARERYVSLNAAVVINFTGTPVCYARSATPQI
jgi:hypothetical protein